MRRLIGVLVVLGGLAGLCFVAMTTHAARLQSMILADAQAVVAAAPHPIDVRVSGRDVTATGRVTDAQGLAQLRTSLTAIDGARVVDVSGIETLPTADPYEMRFTLSGGTVTTDGVVPDAATRALFDGAGETTTLAAGVPDSDWIDVALKIRAALPGVVNGEAVLSNRTLTLRGLARTPDDLSAILTSLGPLPDAYTLDNQIEVEDDGTPLRLTLTLRDGGIYGGGKLPAGMSQDDITALFDLGEPLTLTQAIIPAPDPDWPNVLRTALQALAALVNGDLIVNETNVALIGVATPDGKAGAEALMATLPDTYTLTTDVGLWDDGAPLQMVMTWDGAAATATGKLPADFTPDGPAGSALDTTATFSFLSDTAGDFTVNATAATAALGLMTTGEMTVTKDAITLSGTAASPQVGIAMDRALQFAATTDITRNITYLDDGSPAAWSLNYTAQTGAMIEGRLPAGLTTDDIAATLGLPAISGTPVTAVEDTTLGTSLDTLTIAARYLPEVEVMTYGRDGTGSALDLILSPGVDIDLVANDLAATLPPDVAFSLGPLDPPPADGTTRRNAATGVDEVYTNGFWLPDLAFNTDVAGCSAASAAVLEGAKITFLSGSTRLDATSIRAINGLASVVRPCLDAGLRLEIGGHTDDTGNPDSNNDLSFNRAAEVRGALIDRGATADLMTPVGYGQSQPVADNETEQGRAQNRRTTLVWSQP